VRKRLSVSSKPRARDAFPRGEGDLLARAEREAQRQRIDAFVASREAGSSLTFESLRNGIRLEAIVDAAAAVADYADQALAIVTEEYRPRLECHNGCSYCCRKPGVLITVPELLRILFTVELRFDADAKSAVADRARRYASQIEGRSFDESTNESVPCPLLVDGRCSVYDVRPLVCRGYNSTSMDACRAAHADAGVLVPIFSVLKDVTDGATVGASQSLREAGANDAMVDLGSALNLALAATEEFLQAVLEDRATLAAVQNPTWAEDLWARVQATARELGSTAKSKG
jgi:Fe-S-cluster containining protein